MIDVNIGAYLLVIGISSLCACAFFFFSVRRRLSLSCGKALSLSGCVLLLGIVFAVLGAKLFYFIFRFSYIIRQGLADYWFSLRIDELSYYGGVAGVLFAVFLSAKICGLKPAPVLNSFAPWGALLAAAARFAEYFIYPAGTGALLDDPLPFPIAVNIVYDEYYSESVLAVFMYEGFMSLVAFAVSLFRRDEPRRMLRTLFYLCLPQVLLESLRTEAINLLFVHLEQLVCYLFVEGVLVWYAWKAGRKKFSSWVPALIGLLVCGLIIACEFAVDGKINLGDSRIPEGIIYSVVACGLAAVAVAEHRGNRLSL